MVKKNIKVTICCITYQHGKYIRETLDGFLNQLTNFDYKIIVHDDASLDDTQEIIKEYEKNFPEKIQGIYQDINQYSQGVPFITKYIAPLVEGEFVALCEGDDYWCDPYKLQKQVDALDKNKNSYLCAHKTVEVFENGDVTGMVFPNANFTTGLINAYDILGLPYSFHTSSFLFRSNEWKKYLLKNPQFRKLADVGDIPYVMYFANLGDVYYIDEEMSCYRRGVPTSWSVKEANLYKNENNIKNLIKHPHCMYLSYLEYDKYTNFKYHEICMNKAARYLFQVKVLEKDTKYFLSKEGRKFFCFLPLSRKVTIIGGSVMPKLLKKIYITRLYKINQRIFK